MRCVVYERDDETWDTRRRGYGLTLSNATALAALGLEDRVREVRVLLPHRTCRRCHCAVRRPLTILLAISLLALNRP